MYRDENQRLARILFSLSLCLCAVFLPHSISGARAEAGENILRLHVIANSDSDEDQRVKLRVRDALLTCLPPGESAEESREYLLANGKELLAAAENALARSGAAYGAQLMLGKYPFPERTYGEKTYPAGEYEALRVILGGGNGQNWWCVLFPPLCIVTDGSEPLPQPEEIRFESSIAAWWRSWREKEQCA